MSRFLLGVSLFSAWPSTPLGAQGRSPGGQASDKLLSAESAATAEWILAAKERALGEPFDAALRVALKSRMETLPLDQLAALAKQGEFADIPAALGSVTSDLVYTPVTPCRVFDSRVSQGGPGPIPANTQRNVLVAGTLGFPAQGGLAGGCGVPVGATSAIINFVTVLPSGPGNIRAWAVAVPQPPAPLAAIINYGSVSGLPAIANGVSVPLCNPAATSCAAGDLRLQADTSGTDILGDVVGYFGPVTGLVTSVNSITGPVTIAAGSNISVTPSGSTLTIANTAPVNMGTVTNVATGAGLAGGPISGAGTISVAPGGITSAMIGSGQVVKGVNGVADTVTLAGSDGTTVSTVGSTITVAAPPLPKGAVVLGTPGDKTLIGAGYTELPGGSQEFWTATATTGAASARSAHTAVWTGSKMIVWGGQGPANLNTGGQYDPVSDTWTATATTAGVPDPRYLHTAVWTGSRMIVWGGLNAGVSLNTGGQYDPVGNTWTATATTADVPTTRHTHTAVWTGSRMIVWGGFLSSSNTLNTGGEYDPVNDTWTATATTPGLPSARSAHTAVWTGSRMIVWGGYNGTFAINTGGQYEPATGTWTATAVAGVPVGRYQHTAVWTGSRMVVWGGSFGSSTNTGGQYDPVGDTWTATAPTDAPSARYRHTSVWNGSKMIVWGGFDGAISRTGAQYDPVLNTWTPMANLAGVPSVRYYHAAVWTGWKMIVWGGFDGGPLNTGGQWFMLSFFVKN